jgi:hypothetical protein
LIPGDGRGGGMYDPTVKLLGNQSIKFHTAVTNPPNCAVTGGQGQSYSYTGLNDSASSSSYWLRVYVRYNTLTNWPTNHMKMIEAMGAVYYFQPAGDASRNNPPSWNAFHNGFSHYVPNPGGQIQNNRWYAVELHWSVSPNIYDVWVDGVQIYSGTPTPPAKMSWLLFGVINACSTGSWDVEHWMDGLAVGQQRIYPSAIVEVGNGPNYATASKKIQAVESISDNQVTFRLDTSGLGAGPYYVWVRNNAQQLSGAYFLAGGQVSGPAAPTNLRITP